MDRGITSFSWDQFAWKPASNQKPDLIEKVRSRARNKDPESTFSGESLAAGGFEFDERRWTIPGIGWTKSMQDRS
jgi:hypothetical protein